MLHLQRSAGNQAVVTLVQRSGPGVEKKQSTPSYAPWARYLSGLLGPTATRSIMAMSGITEETKLTDLLFWAGNPDMYGKRIPADRKDLAKEWIRIRDDQVRPALAEPETPSRTGRPTPRSKAPAPPSEPATPTLEKPLPDQDESKPAANGSETAVPAVPARPRSPAGTSASTRLRADLHNYLQAFPHPLVQEIDRDVAHLEALSAAAKAYDKKKSRNEEMGKHRDDLVAGIADLRAKIPQLGSVGIPDGQLATLKANLFRAVADLTPFYFQDRNINILEGKARAKQVGEKTDYNTRTCNLSALAMCLEQLGKTAADYQGDQEKVLAAATKFSKIIGRSVDAVNGKGTDLDALLGLRLPDFIQIAAVVGVMDGTSPAAVRKGVKEAWDKILSVGYLKTLAAQFGAPASVVTFTLDPARYAAADDAASNASSKRQRERLEGQRDRDRRSLVRASGNDRERRRNVLKLAAARRRLTEADRTWKRKRALREIAAYEKALGSMGQARAEKRMPIESYKAAVLDQVGAELDAGKAIIVHVTGHYVRLQNLTEDRVFLDDSASFRNYDLSISYEEARAAAFFKNRVVIG